MTNYGPAVATPTPFSVTNGSSRAGPHFANIEYVFDRKCEANLANPATAPIFFRPGSPATVKARFDPMPFSG
jgi:hypothetical protein